ncbi:MAG: SUMF1/EgtB/PvdO family nonheme iron enzyme [Magnetococcales bacterium]|nr:SUMF1/EgtB/PvdO family nonheme iron enzyme [Magnetococcales bacterium]MBF0151413.1 SUMF1/EgtB/PvdO family nonheme iron enzyme [Magnetococcales bacterium]MBF0632429.1 SUMF1/EgtB/PvdO family nonheme iron enzyme [Magnetococcales bacterium]
MAVVITTTPVKKRKISNRPRCAPGDCVADGRYRVLALLGEGSFGQVYKVCELATGAIGAMKRARHIKNRHLFATELNHLLRLRGAPHVLPLLDHFVDEDGSDVFITEYLDGGNLKEAITARGRLTVPEAMGVLGQMTRALAAAHALDPPILHRDIKPSNILGKRRGDNRVQWFLSDWGLAVDWSGSREPVVSGTYSYTAPEVWDRKRYPVSDIYSLGMTLYFMLFGRPAYEGGSTSVRRLQRAPDPVMVASSCPPGLKNLLEGMLAKDPAHRWSLARVMTHIHKGGRRPRGVMVLQTRLSAGRLWRVRLGDEELDFSWVPGDGTHGGGHEGQTPGSPLSPVQLESWWMGRHSVTRAQFGLFVRETGYVTEAGRRGWGRVWCGEEGRFVLREGVDWQNPGFEQGGDHPVVMVSHKDARAFVRWLAGKVGRWMFLPSRRQWDVACRANHSLAAVMDICRLVERGAGGGTASMQTSSVGAPETLVNAWGLVGMHGNIFEWTGDGGAEGLDLFASTLAGDGKENMGEPRLVSGSTWFSIAPSSSWIGQGWAGEHECNHCLGFRVAGLSLPWES